jgi:signal transduction histidine kinase
VGCPARCGLTTVVPVATNAAAWLDDRRTWGIIAALAAAVIAVVSLIELDDPRLLDVVVVVAAVASYLAHGFVPRCPAWAPFAAAVLAVVTLNTTDLRAEGGMFFVVLALSHLALHEPRRVIVHVCAVAAIAVPGVIAATGDTDWGWQYWMIGFAFGWGFGELGYRFRRARDELASARALVADRAALGERQRIARDLHDVLGHSLTIIMLQLTAARHLLRRDPDEADAALADAERIGRESLNQVRRTVGLLRADGAGSTRDAGGPSPTLEDLDQLLADYRAAGISVQADITGPVASVEAASSVAAYRIVQEAMANVSKHSPSHHTSVTVRVDPDDGVCRITVHDRGDGPPPRRSPGGFGLVGMQERARSVGGTVHAGPVADGWRVSAELPPLRESAGADG